MAPGGAGELRGLISTFDPAVPSESRAGGGHHAAGGHANNPLTSRRRKSERTPSKNQVGGSGRLPAPPGGHGTVTVTVFVEFVQLLSSEASSMLSRESAQACTKYSPGVPLSLNTVTVFVYGVPAPLRRAATA